MSVRRLDANQPTAPFAFTPENLSWAKHTIAKYPQGKQASAVIPLLWRAQEQNAGWVTQKSIEYVADMLDMSYIRVLEVATFYTMFQLSPVGTRAHVQVCGTTPCMLRGANDLKDVCRRKIGEPHHVNADGSLSWEEVECLGACVNAPMVQVFSDTYEDLTPASLEALIDDWQAGRKTPTGPQNGRTNSMALGGSSSLTDVALYDKPRAFKRVEAPPPPAAAVAALPAAPAVPIQAAAKPVAPVQAPVAVPVTPAPLLSAPIAKAKAPPKNFVELVAERVKAGKAAKKAAKSAELPGKPELFAKPVGGKGDDLELIWGVGPGLARMLNKMGIWHFRQIASWTAGELKWVDANLKGFKGRASRDEWVKQAKKLMTGWRPDNDVGEKPKGR